MNTQIDESTSRGNAGVTVGHVEQTPNERRSRTMKGKQNRKTHGTYALKAVVKDVGLGGIARTTKAGRELARRREQIILDAGGKGSLSELKLDQIERYVLTGLYVDTIDGWVFRQRSILIGRGKKSLLLPIIAERSRLIDQMLRLAQAIGLDRKTGSDPDVLEYQRQRDQEKAGGQ